MAIHPLPQLKNPPFRGSDVDTESNGSFFITGMRSQRLRSSFTGRRETICNNMRIQNLTHKQNNSCAEVMHLLDCVGVEEDAASSALLHAAGLNFENPANGTATSIKRGIDECTDLLDQRGVYLQTIIQNMNSVSPTTPQSIAFSATADSLLVPTAKMSVAKELPTSLTENAMEYPSNKPYGREVSKSHLRGRLIPKNGIVVRKIISLREDEAEMNTFFSKVAEIELQKQLNTHQGRNHRRSNILGAATARHDAAQRRKNNAVVLAVRTQAAQRKAHVINNAKIRRTKQLLLLPELREEHALKKERNLIKENSLRNAWLCFVVVSKVHKVIRKVLQVTVKDNCSFVIQSQQATKSAVPLRAMNPRSDAAALVLIQFLGKLVAIRKIKLFLKDWLTATKIPLSIHVFKKAVVAVQRNWRSLGTVRAYRRLVCSIQLDRTLERKVLLLEKEKESFEREKELYLQRHRRDTNQQELEVYSKALCNLMRESGELRGIPVSIKYESIDVFVKEKEFEYGNRILAYLRAKEEFNQRVSNWKANNRFMIEALRHVNSTEVDSGWSSNVHKSVFARSQQQQSAIRATDKTITESVQKQGDYTKPIPPIFQLVVSREDINSLIATVRFKSRELVMKRLAANDDPAPSTRLG